MILLKSTTFHEAHAHNPSYGQSVARWKKVAEDASKSSYMVNLGASLSWKSARSRFELLINSFERIDKMKARESGISEDLGKKEQLLEDMLEERNGGKEDLDLKASKKKKEELVEEARELRDASLARRKRKREGGEERERKRGKAIGAGAGMDGEDEVEIMREIEKKRAERESREKIEMERMRLERDRINVDAEERKENREAVHSLLAFLAKKIE